MSSVWGHLVHFAKFPMLRFLKGYCSQSFHSISTKLYCKYVSQEGIQATTFGNKIKNIFYGTLNFLTQDYGAGNFKRYSYSLNLIWAKLYEDISHHGGIHSITFLGNRANVTNFVVLWNFDMGNNPKIVKCAISWKWLVVERKDEILAPVVLQGAYLRYFYVWFFEFSLESFGALCKLPQVKIFKRLLLSRLSFNFNQTVQTACNRGKYRSLLFLAICQILKVYMAFWREATSATLPLSLLKTMLVSSGKRSSRARKFKASKPLVYYY